MYTIMLSEESKSSFNLYTKGLQSLKFHKDYVHESL